MAHEDIKRPTSIGVIVDGNRRWAKARGLPGIAGHTAGFEKLREFIDWNKEVGVHTLYAYVFSTENWNRTTEEVNYLMDLFRAQFAAGEVKKMHDKGIRIRLAGQLSRLSPDLQTLIQNAEESTKENTEMNLVLCLSYGGQAEILDAVNSLLADASREKGEITKERFEKYLWTYNLPDPDIIIRTSGEHRLSNFLLWRSAYSELFFPEVQFPGLTKQDFQAILDEYAQRQRRFGK